MRRLSISDPVTLRALLRHEVGRSPQGRCLHRLHCALLVGEGVSSLQVARWFGDDPRAVEEWVHDYEERGIAGLRDAPRLGRPPKLTREQMNELRETVAGGGVGANGLGVRWTGRMLRDYIEEHFNVPMSVRQCQRLLRHLESSAESTDAESDRWRRQQRDMADATTEELAPAKPGGMQTTDR